MPIVWVTSSEGNTYGFNADRDGFVQVWIFGACYGTVAGVGVWFGENHPLNISTPVQGCATNNMVEIQAAMWAIQQGLKAGVQNICILTDSEFTIKCATKKKISKWWKIGSGGMQARQHRTGFINTEQLKALDEVVNHPGVNVKWEYVKSNGHYGKKGAITLAKRGAEVYRIPAGNILWRQYDMQWRGVVVQTSITHQTFEKK